jgi:uncharacterized protein YgiM (DUF1202 family)
MRYRLASSSPIVVGGFALLVAACSSPHVIGEGTGTSTAPAAATYLSAAGSDRAGHNDGVTVAPTGKNYVSSRSLNLRQGPSRNFRATALLPAGTTVTPDGYVSGSWWGVVTQFGNGWVDSSGLSAS